MLQVVYKFLLLNDVHVEEIYVYKLQATSTTLTSERHFVFSFQNILSREIYMQMQQGRQGGCILNLSRTVKSNIIYGYTGCDLVLSFLLCNQGRKRLEDMIRVW